MIHTRMQLQHIQYTDHPHIYIYDKQSKFTRKILLILGLVFTLPLLCWPLYMYRINGEFDSIYVFMILGILAFDLVIFGLVYILSYSASALYIDTDNKQFYYKSLGRKFRIINFDDIISVSSLGSGTHQLIQLIQKNGNRKTVTSVKNDEAADFIDDIYTIFYSIKFDPKNNEEISEDLPSNLAGFKLVGSQYIKGGIHDSWRALLIRFALIVGLLFVYYIVYSKGLLLSCDSREAFDGVTCYWVWYGLPIATIVIIYLLSKKQIFDLDKQMHYKSILGYKYEKVPFDNIYRQNAVLEYHNGIYTGTSIYLTHTSGILSVSVHGDKQEYQFTNFAAKHFIKYTSK